jgi:hypothetical protein
MQKKMTLIGARRVALRKLAGGIHAELRARAVVVRLAEHLSGIKTLRRQSNAQASEA